MAHVLHIVDMNPNKRGPIEMQLLEMARQSRERGWRMDVCFPVAAPEWYHHELSSYDCGIHTIADLNGTGCGAALDLIGPDTVVHLHFGSQRRFGPASRRRGARAVVRTEHTFLAPSSRLRRAIRAWRYKGVDVTIACSRYIAEQSVREYRLKAHELRTVLNGVDLAHFRPSGDEKQILRDRWMGLPADAVVICVASHLTPRKRVDMVVRAMPAVLLSVPEARLVIAGDGDQRPALQDVVEELGISYAVTFLTGDNQVSEIYGAADIATLTSWGEGLPGSAMEALACGLPIVATASPGLDEVPEHGVSGLLVADDCTAIADALVGLARDADKRARMGSQGRFRAEHCFDVRRTAAQTFAVYSEFMESRHPTTLLSPAVGTPALNSS